MIKGLFAKDKWVTTVAGLIGGILMLLGFAFPEKFSAEAIASLNLATSDLLIGIGGLIELITTLVAKDPVLASK